jgi:hypothetical protein
MKQSMVFLIIGILFMLTTSSNSREIDKSTIAFWPFDEQQGIYPSCVLSDLSDNDYPMVIGLGGKIVKGKFGNALEPVRQAEFDFVEIKDAVRFGLTQLPVADERTVEPMSWFNADFSALMTSGETHLRKQVGFPRVTRTELNLGDFDWTVEFWFYPLRKTDEKGTVFETGTGPRGENRIYTTLKLNRDLNRFIFSNQPSGTLIEIPTSLEPDAWQHIAFVYDSGENRLTHFVNGKMPSPAISAELKQLPAGEQDYMSVGRNGAWKEPLQGRIDELRFSQGLIYTEKFTPPQSFSYLHNLEQTKQLITGPELLFEGEKPALPIKLDSRKHLFIDDAILETTGEAEFVVNPPRMDEIVMKNIEGPFRKHLSVVEDKDGTIRIYTTVDDDYLAVWISKDGVHFTAPDLPNGHYKGHTNIVLHENVGMGIVFLDPNAPDDQRWKYISDYHRRAVSIFYSKDGLSFERYKQPVLPFRSGSQANIFYDDQKQVYTAFHRSDFGRTRTGDTQRDFVMTETKDLLRPWPFNSLTPAETKRRAEGKRVAELIPWYLDNGPLTPGGFALEYPWIFSPIDSLDPRETDVYVPKAHKYAWAPDTYVAFPVMYFHYEESLPEERRTLGDENRQLGSGPLETQFSGSRNGIDWQRYPRPAYVGIGRHEGIDFKTAYIAYGMVKRENQIWQYVFCEPHYHSPWVRFDEKRSVIKLVQRPDGFVSLDSPYENEVTVITKPLIFKGNRLAINIDTDAVGYAQVGFLDENGNSIEGFAVDECVYINGDFLEKEIEWMQRGKDISELAGKTVQLVFKMRGSKLYALQFINK